MTSCGNRTSPWPRHLTFPLPPPVSLPLLSECVYVLYECVRVRWQPASHCPIIPAALTLCILWGFLLMRERVREKKKGKKKDGETREEEDWREVWAEHRTGVKEQKVNRAEQSCVCVCVCWPVFPQWIPRWEQLIGRPLCRKGCVIWIWMFVSVTMEGGVIVIL